MVVVKENAGIGMAYEGKSNTCWSPLSLLVSAIISYFLVCYNHNAEQIAKFCHHGLTFSALQVVEGDLPFLLQSLFS